MREMIFRGKRVDNGEWVEGYYQCLPNKNYASITGINTKGAMESWRVIYETVGQFTNNHDYYTGEKLFEGDVMERGGKIFVIKFSGCGFVGEQIGKPNFSFSLCLLCHLTSEFMLPGKKIGNIHDNPELLSGNKA